jgi:hypothetical protein
VTTGYENGIQLVRALADVVQPPGEEE